ncbi:BamA/TamA family outer membrane protein [Pseudocnuella soli]|uniref:BamA/TamA family outer membrane protein n=1 Tax=Pseudocnuella soli TaxID=2502779 RepID=UPI001050B982|nr:BamA/TamA family outer membrane protein [Pseudocnuella soli]
MKHPVVLMLLTLFSWCAHAQEDSIQQRIFLIGDGGELHNGKQVVVDWLKKNVDWNDTRNVAIYLGDNIYPLGLPMEGEEGYSFYKRILDSQIDLVRGKKSKAYFVMGNHDWMNGKIGGWQRAINQINYINELELENIAAQPTDGCPGPVPIEISDKVVLVMMDSQWFLYLHDKPGPGSNCSSKTVEEFATELAEIAASHPNQLLVLAMHHPMYSHGSHGGDYTWKEHLFPFTAARKNLYIPLPVLGSIYPIARGVFGNVQDLKHPLYQTMIDVIEPILKSHKSAIAVAGHEHNLQLIEKDSVHYIVSGSGAKLTRLSEKGKMGKLLFSDLNFGFVQIQVRKSGRVTSSFYNINSKDLSDPTFERDLKPIDTVLQQIPKDSIPQLPPNILLAANPKLEGSKLKNFFLGENYRSEWTTPISMEVLDLGKEQGGLTPVRQGGGKQTRSLRVETKEGRQWVLRSIEKFPEAAIPPDLRTPFTKAIIEDGISASYPFAPLSYGPMANAVGLPPIRRKLVYIPDDPRLGRFRNVFKNSMAVLEERQPVWVKKAYNTEELVTRLAKDNDDHVDQREVLKARLLDNFIMDFDRHDDQWQWATRDTGKGKIYYPIPRDHDQAFFVNEGLVPKLARKPWFAPELQGFDVRAKNIRTFNKPARNFDRFFMNELDWSVWERQIDTFLTAMTDSVMAVSLRRQPNETERNHIYEIFSKLQQRRYVFRDEMRKYYNFISSEVNVVGTNQRELFLVNKNDSGYVDVSVFKIDKQGQRSSRIYQRLFNPSETKEIRLFGLKDNDSFQVSGSKSPIRIRMVGGPGEDKFLNNSDGGKKVIVHDVTFESNRFEGDTSIFAKQVSANPRQNMYNRQFYKYGYVHPNVSLGYNIDDGLFLGGRAEWFKQGFRKEPYKARHMLVARRALKTSSTQFRWESEYVQVFKATDLVLRADVRAPVNVTNFFGIGNNTEFDQSAPGRGDRFYRVRYNYADASVLLRRQLQSWFRISYGLTYQGFQMKQQENEGKYVSEYFAASDGNDLFRARHYMGAYLGLDINSRNNRVIPTRGLGFDMKIRPMFGLNGVSNNMTQLSADMRLFASFEPAAKLVYAFRLGAGHNMGNYAFQQAQYLSGTENLRGFRRDRFAGRSMVYNNLELRIKIADFNTYLFPGQVGAFIFNDVGRVWERGDPSGRWHVGNGAGIYVSPIRRFVITTTATRSKEEKFLPMVQFGFFF